MDQAIVTNTQKSSSPVFNRPFVLSMGPQRAGTSWLDRYLRSRGDICMPSGIKEIFFFDRHYDRGLQFYKDHFRPQPEHRLLMEVSTTSFDSPGAPLRVFNIFGNDLKLLCPLRHPVTRSYSLYLHYKRYGLVTGSLQEACEQNPQILSSSHYARHLKEWLSVFNAQNIHFIYQEQMENNLPLFVADVCNLLQIPCLMPSVAVSRRYNSTAAAPFPVLARLAHNGATLLRRYRLYPLINAAKSLGLKKLVLGMEKPDSRPADIPCDDRKWLEDRLDGQVEKLEKLIGPVAHWQPAAS